MALFFILIPMGVFALWYYKHVYLYNKNFFKFVCPDGVPFLGHVLDFLTADYLKVLTGYTEKYGDNVQIRVGPIRTILLTSDYTFLEFLLTSSKILDKAVDYKNLSRWLGTGLLTGAGDKWKKHRRIITPTFHFKVLERFIEIFERNGNILIQKLEQNLEKEIDVCHPITLCTLDIICESAMGTSVKAQDNDDSDYVKSVKNMCRIIVVRAFSLIKNFDWTYYLTDDYQSEKRSLKILHDYTNSVIKSRQELKTQRGDCDENGKRKVFLDLLLDGNVNDELMTFEDIRQEVDTFMFAGHDTTAAAICFTLYCLSKNPEIQKKVLDEQYEVLQSDFDRTIILDDLKNMKFLELVIKESLRLYPSVPFIGRQILEETKWNGMTLPKGVNIILLLFKIHRNPKYFPDPLKFDPSRFENSDRQPFCYLPFSAGPRNCIGQKFAMAEMKSIISRIIRKFELLAADPPYEPKLLAETVIVAENGIRMKLRRREF